MRNVLILFILGAILSLILIMGLGAACLIGKLKEEDLPILLDSQEIAQRALEVVSQKNNSIDFKKLEMSGLNPQTIGGRIKAVFTGNSYDEATLERYIQLGIDATNGNLTGQQLRDIQDKPGDSPLEKKAKALIRAAHDQYQKWLAANDDARRWHKTADEREAERVAEETKRKEAEERERLAKEREDRWEKRADEERRERLTAEAEARADRKRADDVIDKIDRYMERLPAPARLELHLRAPIEEWAMTANARECSDSFIQSK